MSKKITICFYDFDGSLIDSQTPEPGREIWSKHHGKPYPHIGWWSKPESLCIDAFENKPKPEVHQDYLKHAGQPDTRNYILTSRMLKLKHLLKAILDKHGIVMDDILCAHGPLTKGERIIAAINDIERGGDSVGQVNVWEDRNKEIATMESVRGHIEGRGIVLNITKVESDAKD
jgi:hypothetical protein